MARLLYSLLFMCCLSLLAQPLLAQSKGVFRGIVKDVEGQPMPGATVVIPKLQTGALSDGNGLFTINDIPAGSYTVKAYAPEMDTLSYELEMPKGGNVKADLMLRRQVVTDVVEIVGQQAGKIARNKVDAGITSIQAEEINYVPTLGMSDLGVYLQVLPGVVHTGDQGGQLFVRGGTPIQNLVLMDGAIIYNPFHSIGLFSIFDTDILRNVDVYSGGFPARYGGRISSVMDITTRAGNFKRFSGKVEATSIMSGATVEGPLWKPGEDGLAGGSFLFSARHAYLDAVSESIYSYANDSANLPFGFTDLYGKFTFGNGASNASLFGYHQRDQVDYGFPSSVAWTQSGGGLNFQFLPNNTRMILTGALGVSNFRNELLNPDERFPRESGITGFNGRLNFAYSIAQADEFSYGIQLNGFSNDLTITNSLGLQTENQGSNTEFAGYFTYKKAFQRQEMQPDGSIEFFTRAIIEPSVRIHYYNDQNQVMLEPRLRAKLNFDRVSFQASAGRYSQNLITAVSDRDVVQLFQAYLAAPNQSVANQQIDGHFLQVATHLVGGVQVELIPGLSTEVEGWYKNFEQVTNINRRRLFPTDAQFLIETGQAYGVDFILKYQVRKLYLYATYGWARVTRDDGTQTYNPVFDRRHNVNFVGNYRIGQLRAKDDGRPLSSKWEIGTRFQLGSGFPFTQTQGFFEKLTFDNSDAADLISQNGQLGILLSQDLNGGRLPYYHRFDVSFKRRFRLGNAMVLEGNINAINVYNRANIFYFDRIRYERVDQLPVMPTVGASLRW